MKNLKDSFPKSTRTFHERIVTTLGSLPEEKESMNMNKSLFLKRGIIAAACAAVVLGTAALARGPVATIIGHSSSKAEYTEIPDSKRVEKDTGIRELALPEKFENGYEFEEGSIIHNEALGEDGRSMGKYKKVDYRYKRGEGVVSVFVSGNNSEDAPKEEQHTVLADEYNGVRLYYTHYTSKCLPPDYEMTDEDRADEASGKYVFSVGSSKIELYDVQSVNFAAGDKGFGLLCMDESADKSELMEMAREIIDSGDFDGLNSKGEPENKSERDSGTEMVMSSSKTEDFEALNDALNN